VRATIATDDRAVYRTDGEASVNLCLSQNVALAWTNTPKTREHKRHLIVRSGKSEAEVTNNKRRRSRCRAAEANYRQSRSTHGLSAIAELVYLFLILLYRDETGAKRSPVSCLSGSIL